MEYKISEKMKNMKPSAIREIFKSLGVKGAISFAAGNPAPESFPKKEFAEISADIFANSANTALQYSVTEGYPALRELTLARVKEKFKSAGEDDELIITSGGQQGIELACKVLCNEGDTIVSEDPSFIGALNSFRSLGMKIAGVPLCEDGMDTDALCKVLDNNKNAKILYIIPTFHNPAGICTSLEKRKKIYSIARKYDIMIIEDNPYGELRFAGEEIPTLKSLDTDGRVIYCGSYSKVLSAGMRVGFVCGNRAVIQKMVVAKQVEDVHTNIFFQMLCAEYIKKYDISEHISEIRKLYKYKAELMLKALDTYMAKDVKYTRPQGGLFLWCTLPESLKSRGAEFVKRAADKAVFVVPGTAFNCDETMPSDSFRLNYSMPSEDEIDKGVKILSEIIEDMKKE